uniref:Uncharacterized protein n=1 Tax=Solanum tuberosum TaxID=4113 RepID=M1E0B3_SOLTU
MPEGRGISDTNEEAQAKKREGQQNEKATKASIKDVEMRQQRARESIIGASSSRPTIEAMIVVGNDVITNDGAIRVTDSTNDGVVRLTDNTNDGAMIKDVGTKGDPSVVPTGSGKPNPPAC